MKRDCSNAIPQCNSPVQLKSTHQISPLWLYMLGTEGHRSPRQHAVALSPYRLFDEQTWIAEMAAFVKSIAPMQLLGVGDEGFATSLNNQDSAALVASNPGLRHRHVLRLPDHPVAVLISLLRPLYCG
jgi:hypothetical protein